VTDATLPPFLSPQPSAAGWRGALSRLGLVGKCAAVAVLGLALLLPLGFVRAVIAERAGLQQDATHDIRAMWGGEQRIAGPALQIPYRTLDTGTAQQLMLLPQTLEVKVRAVPEIRYRGLFQTVVYVAEIDITGYFPPLGASVLAGRAKRVEWPDATLQLGISDPRSLQILEPPLLAASAITLEPLGAGSQPLGTLGASAAMLAQADPDQPIPFRMRLRLNGSGELALLPLARDTLVAIAAAWDAPSFFGAFAPTTREIGSDGFTARWRIAHLGTGLPQLWDSFDRRLPDTAALERTRFGVAFLQPVTAYRESERASKYGILFIALTFGVWLLFEITAGVRVHVLQYGLVGAALCVFYLLLVSLAEQLGFATAYALSAAAVVLQTTVYTWVVTRRRMLVVMFAATVAGLYAYLFVLLRLETLSLIGGSLVLFAALSVAMWATRRLGAGRQGA
jgi:inner membrane protein